MSLKTQILYSESKPLYTFLIVLLLIFTQSCNHDSPTGEMSPPPLPSGVPNSLALDNLSLIRNLERSRRTDTWLVQISAPGLKRDGRISDGNAWGYTFAKANPYTLYSWEVFSDGHIEESDGFQPGASPGVHFSGTDIERFVKLNSDRTLNIAIKNGANIYLKKYPDALISMRYSGVCRMQFENLGTFCPIDITLSSETGEILDKNLTCNDK